MRILRSVVATAGMSIAVVACGSSSTPTAAATSPAATPTPVATPSGPPKAQATLAGPASLAGGVTVSSIECSFPSISGEQIIVNGTAAAAAPISVRLTLTASAVSVLLDTGSGTSFHARTFAGTGVTGFNAATGAQFSGPLSDTTAANENGTGIGELTSITGSVDCAGQTPGTSTLALTGTVAQGAMSGSITSVHVVCLSATNEVETFGVTQVGGAPAATAVFAFSGKFTVDLLPASGAGEFFTSSASASVTTSGAGATVSGDATEAVASGATASTIHVSGQSTCGSSTTP